MPKFFGFFAFFLLFACEKNSYDDKFVLAYAELRIAERQYGETENGKATRFQILEQYGFSAEYFENKMEEIKKEPKSWQEFQKTLMKILDSIADDLKKQEE